LTDSDSIQATSVVACSNVFFLEAVATCALTQPGVVAIWHKFPGYSPATGGPNVLDTISVDIVAGWGTRWIKVTARQPAALDRLSIDADSRQSPDAIEPSNHLEIITTFY
jgi:hypothetical protein